MSGFRTSRMLNSISGPSILPTKPLVRPLPFRGSSSLTGLKSKPHADLAAPPRALLQLCKPVPTLLGGRAPESQSFCKKQVHPWTLRHSYGSRDRKSDVITMDALCLFFFLMSLCYRLRLIFSQPPSALGGE